MHAKALDLTGNKWEFLTKAKSGQKYIICNADEGDPGAYMNRNEIERAPHSLLEGMIIGGYVMASSQGIIYVRAEYPVAVHHLNRSSSKPANMACWAKIFLAAGRPRIGPLFKLLHSRDRRSGLAHSSREPRQRIIRRYFPLLNL